MTPVEHYWEPDRYEPEEMPPNGKGSILWRVRDHRNAGAHVQDVIDLDGTVGVLDFPTGESADAWIGRVRHMTEGLVRPDADR